ncbi:hypothetical protein BH09MYX1_BH09MYX1_29310 [soil metagenome]
MNETHWIMVDLETSGPIYGTHSLVEIGAAVGTRSRGVIETFSTLVRPIGESVVASRKTFERARVDGVEPAIAIQRFADFAAPHLEARARFIARPACFDWPWLVYYAWTFPGKNPFGFKATCASSWFDARGKRFQVEIPHVAVEDASIQLRHFLDQG